uniref:DNA polymerase delta 4, accessory subunit n=1 Tax=Amphiprion percula TaxID=161767 RepID=A0A3P8TW46_AMPPE
MTTRRGLITDSFKVVKKARTAEKQEKTPSPPPSQNEDQTETIREEELQKLRQFDLDWRFGPCTGISRLERWERAKLHDLNPPEEIRELLQMCTDPEYSQSLWSEKVEDGCLQAKNTSRFSSVNQVSIKLDSSRHFRILSRAVKARVR